MAKVVSDYSLSVDLKVFPRGEAELLTCRGSLAMIVVTIQGNANITLLKTTNGQGYRHVGDTTGKVLRDVVEMGRWYRFKARIVPV